MFEKKIGKKKPESCTSGYQEVVYEDHREAYATNFQYNSVALNIFMSRI